MLALGRHRGPRVSISGQTVVVTAVAGQTAAAGPHAHGLSQDGDLLAWRSSDEGRSWSKPVAINDVPGSAREGLHSIAVSNDGEMAAVWLDLRGSGTKLYGAFSSDHGVSWSKNVLLYESSDGTICQCCDPSIAFTGPASCARLCSETSSGIAATCIVIELAIERRYIRRKETRSGIVADQRLPHGRRGNRLQPRQNVHRLAA